ncbi:MAG: GAF domain-containing protein, partial [Cryomorphaceae bacterium]
MSKVDLFKEKFPFKTELNFSRIIDFWEQQAHSENNVVADNAKSVLEVIKSEPELLGPIADYSIIEKHKEKVEVLLSDIFSKATWEQEMKGVLPAFEVECFYETPEFNRVVNLFRAGDDFVAEEQFVESIYFQTIGAYVAILENFYNFPVERQPFRVISLKDSDTGLERFFHGRMNMEFVDLILEEELPELSEEDLIELVNNYRNIDLWVEKLPPRCFRFSGVGIVDLVEVTEQQILSTLKADLLKPGALNSYESVSAIEECFKRLMAREVKIGIAFYQRLRDSVVFIGTKIDPSEEDKLNDFNCKMNDLNVKDMMAPYFERKEPVVLTNVNTAKIDEMMRSTLLDFDIQSVILVPLILEDQVVGLFELVSQEVNAFSSLDLLRFEDLIPLLAIAVERVRDAEETEVTKIIKDKFTSLHSAVEWKFQQVALNYLDAQNNNQKKRLEEVVFENVHPLYGSSDVRNSSTIRNSCIQIDLVTQLDMVSDVFKKVIQKHPFPIYKELDFEVQN